MRAYRSLLRVGRGMATSAGEGPGGAGAFRQAWLDKAPDTQEPPLTPTDYANQAQHEPNQQVDPKERGKLAFSFMLPHQTLAKQEEVRTKRRRNERRGRERMGRGVEGS